MIVRFLSCQGRALSPLQRIFAHNSAELDMGKWTPACGRLGCLHPSFSTATPSLSDVPYGGNEFSEGNAEVFRFNEKLNTPDAKECFEDGKTMQPGIETKAMSDAFQGIYRAVVIGEAGCAPYQKMLKNGSVTLFSVGTSGLRNNRKPFENETPDQYARRSLVQWHRIAIYQHRLGDLTMKYVKKGSQVYVEGNLETRVFLEPESNSIKRIQEIAVRQNGCIVFLDQNKAKV